MCVHVHVMSWCVYGEKTVNVHACHSVRMVRRQQMCVRVHVCHGVSMVRRQRMCVRACMYVTVWGW